MTSRLGTGKLLTFFLQCTVWAGSYLAYLFVAQKQPINSCFTCLGGTCGSHMLLFIYSEFIFYDNFPYICSAMHIFGTGKFTSSQRAVTPTIDSFMWNHEWGPFSFISNWANMGFFTKPTCVIQFLIFFFFFSNTIFTVIRCSDWLTGIRNRT